MSVYFSLALNNFACCILMVVNHGEGRGVVLDLIMDLLKPSYFNSDIRDWRITA